MACCDTAKRVERKFNYLIYKSIGLYKLFKSTFIKNNDQATFPSGCSGEYLLFLNDYVLISTNINKDLLLLGINNTQ